jgi:hypothetical protein
MKQNKIKTKCFRKISLEESANMFFEITTEGAQFKSYLHIMKL